ncbi:MAG: signal peptidase I [Blautia sp.]|jgi:signal peptidase I
MGKKKLQDAKERLGNSKAKPVLLWVFEILVVLFFAAVVAIFFFQSVTMRENSMEPTLSTGDKMFMNRLAYKLSGPNRGDIIVFKTNGNEDAALHIKRVIGMPGETIQIKDGQILIDGETYKEGKDFPSISNAGVAADPVSLGSGEYFVLGDNRNNSEDSRYGDIGKVQKKYIVGKVWFVFSPVSKLGFLRS